MIAITECISGQSFESIRLTAQYFKIPEASIKKLLASQETSVINGRKLKFVRRETSIKGVSVSCGPAKKMPFGKYKGVTIEKIKDLKYLEWFYSLNGVHSRVRVSVKSRIDQLKYSVK